MKKVLLTIVLLSFGIWGCSESTSITAPEKSDPQQSFLKVSSSNSSVLMKTVVSKTIDGDRGGLIRINLANEEEEFGARGWLYFPRESFDGEEVISVTLAEHIAALDFEPSGISLELPAHLTLKFNGVEFDDAEEGEIDFYYIDTNNQLVKVDYRKLIVNKRKGWVIVVDAKLGHFSRYGFTK